MQTEKNHTRRYLGTAALGAIVGALVILFVVGAGAKMMARRMGKMMCERMSAMMAEGRQPGEI